MRYYTVFMFRFLCASCLVYLIVPHVRGQQGLSAIDSTTKVILLGEDSVAIKIFSTPSPKMVYVHVHENEEAALTAGKAILAERGGKLVTLAHTPAGPKNRNIRFRHKKIVYEFDPNRIYTASDSVLENSIRIVKGKGAVTGEVKAIVRNLSDNLWAEIDSFPMIVAIHNNKNTPPMVKNLWFFWCQAIAESFNIASYIMRSDYASESNKSCEDIYINPRVNNSEFFIVTQREDFLHFFTARYNVVLQNENPVDDGSMSVFATQKGIRYINAEAKMGRLEEQMKMLRLIPQVD